MKTDGPSWQCWQCPSYVWQLGRGRAAVIHTGQTQHHNVSTTSCCSTASKQMHHCCPLENNVEFIDCVQGRACPSVSTKSAPSRGVSGSKANTWFLGPRESTSKRFGGFYRVTLCYIHPFNGPLSGTTRVNRYQKGKTNLDFTEARDSELHQLGHMQVCTSIQTDNHASIPPLSFLQAGCPSCHPTNSVKALKAYTMLC